MTQWHVYGEKFDALTQREKIMALVAGLTIIVMVGFTYGIEPLFDNNQRMKSEISTLQIQAKSLELQEQTYQQALGIDPDEEYRVQLDELKSRMETMDATFADEINQLVPPSAMPSLMASMLKLSGSLRLLSMEALPPVNLFADNADMKDIPLYQHGVKMAFTGTYANAQAFLAQLEQTEWQVYWRVMHFDVESYPSALLTIEFYTLSTEEVFIRV